MSSEGGTEDAAAEGLPVPAPTGADQRREHVRVDVRRPILLSGGDQGQVGISTYSVDLSGNGILMAGPDNLEVGSRVDVQIALSPRGTRIVASGTVVRAGEDGHRAVALDEIREGEQRRLVRFLFSLQRLALRNRHRENQDGE